MSQTTDRGILSPKACFVFFVIPTLCLLAELCVAQNQTYCETKKCQVDQDAQGNYRATFWCKGSYPISGTCSSPQQQVLYEQNPAQVDCACSAGVCGTGSTIALHLTCGSSAQTASYTVNCVARGGPAYVTVNSTLSCCITCDPHGGGGGGCATTDLDHDGWDACEDCDDTYYDPYNTCLGPTCEGCSLRRRLL